MNILPRIGIEEIRFGMTRDEVVDIWGKAKLEDRRSFGPDSPDHFTVTWSYFDRIELVFESCDNYQLSEISTKSDSVTLNNRVLIGESVKEVEIQYPELELVYDFGDMQHYSIERTDVSFFVVGDCVISIVAVAEYDESRESYIWPQKDN